MDAYLQYITCDECIDNYVHLQTPHSAVMSSWLQLDCYSSNVIECNRVPYLHLSIMFFIMYHIEQTRWCYDTFDGTPWASGEALSQGVRPFAVIEWHLMFCEVFFCCFCCQPPVAAQDEEMDT
jgi:hypothetical protein